MSAKRALCLLPPIGSGFCFGGCQGELTEGALPKLTLRSANVSGLEPLKARSCKRLTSPQGLSLTDWFGWQASSYAVRDKDHCVLGFKAGIR